MSLCLPESVESRVSSLFFCLIRKKNMAYNREERE